MPSGCARTYDCPTMQLNHIANGVKTEVKTDVKTEVGQNQRLLFHVEAEQRLESPLPAAVIEEAVNELVASLSQLRLVTKSSVTLSTPDFQPYPLIYEHVAKIVIPDIDLHRTTVLEPINVAGGLFDIHVYRVNDTSPENEQLEGDEELAAATHQMLPHAELEGLWESLIYDSRIKQELLAYASTSLRMSDAGVDPNLVACNRVVLLHGPPGTGKTSLCKALAQKLAIRLSRRYSIGQLLEINSHSLFSKWFSESGKLVMKMFQNIEEQLSDPDCLVFLLIDEVESLTAARKAASNGNEPSDAIRVVNALLTQIDQIKRHPNVFILTTSNLTGSIDLAFVDRADIKQYIGPPSPKAIETIFASSARELMEKGVIDGDSNMPIQISSSQLIEKCVGFSGRTLRKLPFIAFALFVPPSTKPSIGNFFVALEMAVDRQLQERSHIPDEG